MKQDLSLPSAPALTSELIGAVLRVGFVSRAPRLELRRLLIGGALARVSVGVVVVVKCVAATKQRLHSRCLECPLDCGRLVGSCSADDVRHRQRGFIGEYRWVGVNPKCER